ncbi:hypothetical protein [Pseudomonas putida]|uniref:hypothetical protein n=1 Tax=Pseudomonas putida TaxID=303 RepID=UPI001198B60B|nr:hypothetical protein [Pseudomonas putida]QDY37590.1 hypothetical protein CHR26_15525 [Pseudomonas putida]
MIDAIEAVLKHWGQSVRCDAPSGGLASPAGALMEWLGCIPRAGSSGSRVLLAGAGPDYLASEVEAALAAIERQDGCEMLVALARLRYAFEPALTKSAQVRDLQLGHGEAGRKAYTRLVHRLHQTVEAELKVRHFKSENQLREAKRKGDQVRKASRRQARKAHFARGIELRRQDPADLSSGDSAPVGAVAPVQAPVRNNR